MGTPTFVAPGDGWDENDPEAWGQDKIDERLLQDARVDRVKGMTTNNEEVSLSQADREDIINAAREFCRVHDVSISALAKMVGCSGSTLSEALNGTYKGDPDNILRKITPAINEYHRSKSGPGKGGYVTTHVAQQIFAALKYASKVKAMVAVYGPSGVGKTFTVKALLAKEFPSGIYIETNDTCRSVKDLYQLLHKVLRIRLYSGQPRNADYATGIYDKLRDSGRMIVIDEADGLLPAAMNCLRQLHDATECPIVFVGRPNLIDKINATANNPNIGASFIGRLAGQFHLEEGEPGDGSSGSDQWICSAEQMAEMLKRFKVRFSVDSIRFLCSVAHLTAVMGGDIKEAGGLRLAMRIAEMAAIVFSGQQITVPMLESATVKIRGRKWSLMIMGIVRESMRKDTGRKAATA